MSASACGCPVGMEVGAVAIPEGTVPGPATPASRRTGSEDRTQAQREAVLGLHYQLNKLLNWDVSQTCS